MWQGKKISVIFPTFNEKDSIRAAVLDFFATGVVDEVIVVNNNAAAGTDEEVAGTGATLVYEIKQGYGHAIRKGFEVAVGDGVIVSEPDGTFAGRDVVFGTPTHREFIWDGSNMGWWLKWGNYGVAKLMEFLFNSSTLSDVGCTMRYLSRPALETISPHFTGGGSAFGLEMMLLTFIHGQRVVQVPVNYQRRVGVSSVTGHTSKALILGFQMIGMVLRYRLASLPKLGPLKVLFARPGGGARK
ncbi:MAG: glycosyltransferase family 2 protein [Dehalococcoidia bacterium]|nr:glycosyltransferase family 2 protein [Dehalococcoidia bacterium]